MKSEEDIKQDLSWRLSDGEGIPGNWFFYDSTAWWRWLPVIAWRSSWQIQHQVHWTEWQ